MAWFGLVPDPEIPGAEMPSEYASGFSRAQRFGLGELDSTRGIDDQQSQLAKMLRAQAEGRMPSIAGKQYAQALEQSQAAATSQLASARGLSPAQAQQLLMARQAAATQQAAGQSAILRLQEQQAAQGLYAQALEHQRQQQILGASTAAGLASTSGEMGLAQQRMEQQRRMMQYAQNQSRQQQLESGLATGVGSVLGGIVGSVAGPAGTMAGASLGGKLGGMLAGGDGTGGTAADYAALTPAKTKAHGGRVQPEIPGDAEFDGDTRSNDTVPAMLSPGEIVLPRSVAQAKNAPQKAKEFVAALKKHKRPKPKDYTQALLRLKELESRMDAMEALADLEAEQEG